MKKNLFISIITSNSIFNIYPDSIEKCAGLNYSVNLRVNGLIFMIISNKHFKHNLKFDFYDSETCTNYYELKL